MNKKASFHGIEFEIGDHRMPIDIPYAVKDTPVVRKFMVTASLKSYQILRKNPGKRLKMTHVTGRQYVIEKAFASERYTTLQTGEVQFSIDDES